MNHPPDKVLLEAVRRHGWSARYQRLFLNDYGPILRRALLCELGRRFGYEMLSGLAEHLHALQTGQAPPTSGVSGQLLDLACDTWQDICSELFREQEHTIMKYVQHTEERRRQGREPLSFEAFLRGLVRFKLLQNLRRQPLGFASLDIPVDDSEAVWEENLAAPSEEQAWADEVDVHWEQLLHCCIPDPEEAERNLRLALMGHKERLLCWACCRLKGKLNSAGRENLVAFIAFFCSQRGPQRLLEPLPKQSELCLATVSGRYWRWEEDICRIFGKEIRKDRVLAQIREELLRSPYRDLVQGSEA